MKLSNKLKMSLEKFTSSNYKYLVAKNWVKNLDTKDLSFIMFVDYNSLDKDLDKKKRLLGLIPDCVSYFVIDSETFYKGIKNMAKFLVNEILKHDKFRETIERNCFSRFSLEARFEMFLKYIYE